jgi:murein DD-endopeptidase MepM/ murein hydrolase activator NlpD
VITAKLVKENGVLVKRSIVSEKVTLMASDQVILQGTKKAPSTAATGRMAKPYSRGSYSSGFGRRWGRMHTGIDWSMPVGSPIYAADGGVVSESGNDGAYGKCIIINHGNGIKTRYAHNSALLVKAGDKVFKGQKISNSGNTGRTTGPHLHFEVLKNGSPVNPLNYLK